MVGNHQISIHWNKWLALGFQCPITPFITGLGAHLAWQNLHVTRAFYPQKRTAPTWGFVPWFLDISHICTYTYIYFGTYYYYIYTYLFYMLQYTLYLSNFPNRSMLLPTSPSSQILPQLPAVDASSRMTKPPGHRLQWVISWHRFASLNTLAKLQAQWPSVFQKTNRRLGREWLTEGWRSHLGKSPLEN